MIKTDLCDLLNIKYPIIQGGMAWVATAELAAAVSNAGGLGIIGAGSAPKEVIKEEIDKTRRLTDKPFGVNIYFMSPFADDIMDLVIEEKVAAITTGAGNPGKYIDRLKKENIKIFPVIPSVSLAKRLERMGVDGVIAEGMECGGHVGTMTTMPLIPQVVDAVDIPVIAAGGIADGRGLAASLALGAVGVQMGTRFLCAEECIVHDNYKDAILKAKDRDTVLTGLRGHYVRVLKNKLTRVYENLEKSNATEEEIEKLGLGKFKKAALEGDVEMGTLMAGQVAGMINKVEKAEDIISEIIRDAEKTIVNLQKYID